MGDHFVVSDMWKLAFTRQEPQRRLPRALARNPDAEGRRLVAGEQPRLLDGERVLLF